MEKKAMDPNLIGLIHPWFGLNIQDNIKDGDNAIIEITTKDFLGLGAVDLSFFIDSRVLPSMGEITQNLGPNPIPGTFQLNPAVIPAGINIGVLPKENVPTYDTSPFRRVTIGMYGDSYHIMSMPDGWLLRICLPYNSVLLKSSILAWNHTIDNGKTPAPNDEEWYACDASSPFPPFFIPTAKVKMDADGNPVNLRQVVQLDRNGEPIVWQGKTAMYWDVDREEVDYSAFYSEPGRIGPVEEKHVFAPGNSKVSDKVYYGFGTDGSLIPNQKVYALNVETGEKIEVKTDKNGAFEINLPHGDYFLKVDNYCVLDWSKCKGDNDDLVYARNLLDKLVPIPKGMEWMILGAFGGAFSETGFTSLKNIIIDANPCIRTPGSGYLGYWQSHADPSTWPDRSEEYHEGLPNPWGLYLAQKPLPGDGFIGEGIYIRVEADMHIPLHIIGISDVNGTGYVAGMEKKVICQHMIVSTTGKVGHKVTVKTRCKNEAVKGTPYCYLKTHQSP